MNNDKINWSDLSEKEKEQVAESLAECFVYAYKKAMREIALETAYELATPKWMKKINQLLCFHDWQVTYSSIPENHFKCKKCNKRKVEYL